MGETASALEWTKETAQTMPESLCSSVTHLQLGGESQFHFRMSLTKQYKVLILLNLYCCGHVFLYSVWWNGNEYSSLLHIKVPWLSQREILCVTVLVASWTSLLFFGWNTIAAWNNDWNINYGYSNSGILEDIFFKVNDASLTPQGKQLTLCMTKPNARRK